MTVAGLLCILLSTAAHATIRVVAHTGGPAPGGGTFLGLGEPSLNENGVAAFAATVRNGRGGIFLGTGGDHRTPGPSWLGMASGAPLPGIDGASADYFGGPAINSSSQVAVLAEDDGAPGQGIEGHGIVLGTEGALATVAWTGMAPPEGNGVFRGFMLDSNADPTLNDRGDVAFYADLSGTSGGRGDNAGLYVGNGTSLHRVARLGDPVPGSPNEVFQSFVWGGDVFPPPRLNNRGEIAFSGGPEFAYGIYLYSQGSISELVRIGQGLPRGGGVFDEFYNPLLNDAGQVVVKADIKLDGSRERATGIFRITGGTIETIIQTGDSLPGGAFAGRSGFVDVNDLGEMVFTTEVVDENSIYRGQALLLSDGADLIELSRTREPPPDGPGLFESFYSPLINDAGQIAFLGHLENARPGGADADALYFFDDELGLVEIIRSTDTFLNQGLSNIFFGDRGHNPNRRGLNSWRQLNDAGQVAFGLEFNEVASAVVVFEIPEPSTWSLLTIAFFAAASWGMGRIA
jgi:hypothetical protein